VRESRARGAGGAASGEGGAWELTSEFEVVGAGGADGSKVLLRPFAGPRRCARGLSLSPLTSTRIMESGFESASSFVLVCRNSL